MKRFTTISLVFVVLLSGCASLGNRTPAVPQGLDTYTGLASALESNADILVYDVRTPEEYATGHVPGAINIPHGEIAKKLPFWKKNDVVVVYCASGGRSFMAYEALTAKRFKHVIDFGGVGNWEGDLVMGTDPE